MAKLLNTDGTAFEISPANGKNFTLAEAQALVGGYVELLDVGFLKKIDEHGCDSITSDALESVDGGATAKLIEITEEDTFIANEEGLIRNLPLNLLASKLSGRYLVGPIILCKQSEFL